MMFLGGVVFMALAIFYLLNYFGSPIESIPSIFYELILIKIALILSGLLLLYASFTRITYGLQKIFSVIAGLIMAFFGAFPLLLDLGLLNSILPFEIKFTIPPIILAVVLLIYGFYLMVSAYRVYRAMRMYRY